MSSVQNPTDPLIKLIAQSPDAIAQHDAQGRYLSASPVLANLLGLAPSEMINQTPHDLIAQVQAYPTLVDFLQQTQANLQQVIHTRQSETVVHQLALGEAVRIFETTYTPILSEDRQELLYVFSLGREITRHYSLPQNGMKALEPAIVGAEMPGLEDAAASYQEAANSPMPVAADPAPAPAVQPLPRLVKRSPAVDLISQSNELLQVVLDNIPQYIFWKNRDSVYIGCNRGWATMAGIGDPEAVVGLTDNDLPWTQEQKDWYLECDQRVMDTDTPMLRIKQSQLQGDGRLTWRETSKLPLHDAQGNVIGLLGTIEDVTERKIAEDLLKQSEAKFRKLAKQEELFNRISTQIRNSLKIDNILQTTVEEVRQLFEADRVLVYQFGHDWQGKVVVEDVLAPWSSTLGEMGTDNCFPQGFAHLYQQGRVRAIENITTAGLDDCHVRYLRGLDVWGNLIVPILVRDDLWGLIIAHQCSGPRRWKDTETELMQALAGQVGVAIQQAELYEQATQSALQAQQQAEQIQATLRELKQTQAQLVQTEKMSSLGQLVAGIAHEINNPVNFIYGNITYIKDYVQDLTELVGLYRQHYPDPVTAIAQQIDAIELDYLLADLDKILGSFKVGAERIRQIVLSLRNFSRLDEADVKAVNLHEGLDSTLLILHHRFKERPGHPIICIEKHYGDLPLVECYPSQLNQVFMNILSNAIDALEPSGAPHTPVDATRGEAAHHPKITLTTAMESGWAVVRIRDNGPGMPEAVRARLFDPFFTTKPVGKGTGLGLSISHQIVVEKHGGQITCESQPGQGTEFRVAIPCRQMVAKPA